MKKIIIILLCFCSYAVTANDDIAYIQEELNISNKFGLSSSGYQYNSELIGELEECSAKGNPYCSRRLGDIFYGLLHYDSAQEFYLKCSGECYGSCDFQLGIMYAKGLGVLQSDEKAFLFSEKSAKLGMSEAAYNVSVYYENQAIDLYNDHTNDGRKKYYNNLIHEYAWLKVAVAMGEPVYVSYADQKRLPIASLIIKRRTVLANQGYIKDADKLAIEICSKIKRCRK